MAEDRLTQKRKAAPAPTQAKPDDKAILKAVRDYESPFAELISMAGVLDDRVNELFSHGETQRRLTGQEDTYYIPEFQRERTQFCALHLLDMIEAFRRKYYLDVHGDPDPDGEGTR